MAEAHKEASHASSRCPHLSRLKQAALPSHPWQGHRAHTTTPHHTTERNNRRTAGPSRLLLPDAGCFSAPTCAHSLPPALLADADPLGKAWFFQWFRGADTGESDSFGGRVCACLPACVRGREPKYLQGARGKGAAGAP